MVMNSEFTFKLYSAESTTPEGARLLSILMVPLLSPRKPKEEMSLVLKVDVAEGLLK